MKCIINESNFFNSIILLGLLILINFSFVKSDLPVHCLAGDIEGIWKLYMTDNEGDNSLKCGHEHPDLNLDHLHSFEELNFKKKYEYLIKLNRPNLVVSINDNTKKIGSWTMVYDEGFEFSLKNYDFFAFSRYQHTGDTAPTNSDTEDTSGYKSICNKTFVGWFRNKETNNNWGCFWGEKISNHNKFDISKIEMGDLFNFNSLPLKGKSTTHIKKQKKTNKLILEPLSDIHHLVLKNKKKKEEIILDESNEDDKDIDSPEDNKRDIKEEENEEEEDKKDENEEQNFIEKKTEKKSKLQIQTPKFVDFLKNLIQLSKNGDSESLSKVPHLDIYFLNNIKTGKDNSQFLELSVESKLFQPDKDYVDKINNPRNNYKWQATIYPEFIGRSYSSMRNLLGNSNSNNRIFYSSSNDEINFIELETKLKNQDNNLPSSFTWTNVDGVNYDSPIRKQGECGSCYAIAMLSVYESRSRIRSNNRQKPILSTSSILGCSRTNQGCSGGYPFLVGKFGVEQGFVEDNCQPYNEEDKQCKSICFEEKVWRAKDYGYVGGYYGGCSEDKMMAEIYKNGPIVVAINATPELYYYKSGIFHSEAQKKEGQVEKGVKPWEYTNHAVVAVGWGEENVKGNLEKYWLLKNSWGDSWGEGGYFRISRGVNMASVEAQAIYLSPDI